jgi:hypothetical protein
MYLPPPGEYESKEKSKAVTVNPVTGPDSP